jgi:hypothetical protein
MSHNVIVWVHGDNLNPHGPALAAYPDAPAIWVWDEALLAQWRISLKRVLFIYECLLELPVVIRRGQMVNELARFAAAQGAATIATADSPSPRFRAICERLRQAGFEVEVHAERPFLDYNGRLDLQRFSRYWRVAQKYAFD